MTSNQRAIRKWEVFPGRNKFYCNGLLMTAPNTTIFYLTVVLITGTSTLFFIFDCPFLAERISIGIPIAGAVLYFFTMCSLLRTTFSDPGILVRASQDEASYIEKQIEVPNSLNSPTYRPPPRTKEITVRGQTVKLKYCFTCKIFRPPRASHCSLCDNCVDRFDHHCPWVANCVGRRNYRFFYMFILSLAFLAVFIFACAITHLVLLQTETKDFLDVIKMSPFSLIVSIICFLSVWSVIGLAGFHTYLTSSNQTTNEDIKGSFSNKGSGGGGGNPYSRGNICLNCFYILCGPLQPSLIDRRGFVTEEYKNQMQYDTPITQSPPIVVQQLPTNLSMNGPKDYSPNEIQNSPNTHVHGVYRQRSCDNLQNEKSSSVSHLVENEQSVGSTHFKIPRTPQKNFTSGDESIEIVSETNEKSLKNSESYTYFKSPTFNHVKSEEAPQYSNINVPSSPIVVPNLIKNAASDHVYSNIDENYTGSEANNRFMSNNIELDLDDPLLTSSFTKKSDQINVYDASSSPHAVEGQSSNKIIPSASSSSTGTQVTSIELKNVLNDVAFKKPALEQSNNNNTNVSILKETMINTELDLDSLDGSQVGLMKTS